jgi:tetratricopeptide (TPR) repeat protein
MLHANLMLLDGEVSERTEESRDKALSKYLEALATLSQPEMQRTSALLRLLGRLHSKLALAFERNGELQEAAAHAIAAIAPEFRRGSTGFNLLARPIIALGQPDKALEFCRTALSDADGDGTHQGNRVTFSSIASHHIYQIKSSTRLIENIGRLIAVISTTLPASSETRNVVAQLRDLAGFVVFAYERRAGPDDVDSREQLNASIAEVNSTLLKLDLNVKALPFITANAQESPRAPSFDDDER